MSFIKTLILTAGIALPTAATADWNGWYAGLSTGELSNGEFGLEGFSDSDIDDASTFGGFFGRNSQNGPWVFGFEVELLSADDTPVDSDRDENLASPIIDLKSRIGYAAGSIMAYGVFGSSIMSVEGPITDVAGAGFALGAGLEYQVADQFMIGVEYLTRQTTGEAEVDLGFITTDRDVDIDADTVSLRAAFKF
ncbi:outer membrane beta-barrel protein [Cognatiyoonia sp. IB215446]|uniref:outer membrane beta-barrel protein n=1 Tax=Cognatiyoonia sp. IB215446 TaxID=3097355 RepID=UPI002A179ED9|nr:outer membrane beta-barrel protein [Cognatiyoonia sp. IB215446]MDX8349756.1 outer membrane beta-barrel protein [Cognatiyoonia sp. IB215446]